MRRSKSDSHPRGPKPYVSPIEELDAGQKVRDAHGNRVGVVLESAQQYSHPKAQPVHSYLIRWDDGQVEAVAESAFVPAHGLELVD